MLSSTQCSPSFGGCRVMCVTTSSMLGCFAGTDALAVPLIARKQVSSFSSQITTRSLFMSARPGSARVLAMHGVLVAAVLAVCTSASPLPPALGVRLSMPNAFAFFSHFEFTDPTNETATDLVLSIMNKDLNHRFEVGEIGNILLTCNLTVDQDRKGYSGIEIYPNAAAWSQHKANSNWTDLAVLNSLVTQTRGYVVGPEVVYCSMPSPM